MQESTGLETLKLGSLLTRSLNLRVQEPTGLGARPCPQGLSWAEAPASMMSTPQAGSSKLVMCSSTKCFSFRQKAPCCWGGVQALSNLQEPHCPCSRMPGVRSARVGGGGTAGIWWGWGRAQDQDCLSFQVQRGVERKGGELGDRSAGDRGRAFVLALWMSFRVELNCQLMRFPHHVPLSSLGPKDLFPRQQQGAEPPPCPQRQEDSQSKCRNSKLVINLSIPTASLLAAAALTTGVTGRSRNTGAEGALVSSPPCFVCWFVRACLGR